jgi:hypothetical protein
MFGSLFAVVIFGLLTFSACSKTPSEKAAERKVERALEKATGEKVDLDIDKGKVEIQGEESKTTIEYGGTVWPNDLPEGVTKFEAGTIKGVTKGQRPNGQAWTILFENVEAGAINPYVESLKAGGWTILAQMTMGQGSTFQAEKNAVKIMGMYNLAEKVLSLSVVVEKD